MSARAFLHGQVPKLKQVEIEYAKQAFLRYPSAGGPGVDKRTRQFVERVLWGIVFFGKETGGP